jgi:hypothetical protein
VARTVPSNGPPHTDGLIYGLACSNVSTAMRQLRCGHMYEGAEKGQVPALGQTPAQKLLGPKSSAQLCRFPLLISTHGGSGATSQR